MSVAMLRWMFSVLRVVLIWCGLLLQKRARENPPNSKIPESGVRTLRRKFGGEMTLEHTDQVIPVHSWPQPLRGMIDDVLVSQTVYNLLSFFHLSPLSPFIVPSFFPSFFYLPSSLSLSLFRKIPPRVRPVIKSSSTR